MMNYVLLHLCCLLSLNIFSRRVTYYCFFLHAQHYPFFDFVASPFENKRDVWRQYDGYFFFLQNSLIKLPCVCFLLNKFLQLLGVKNSVKTKDPDSIGVKLDHRWNPVVCEAKTLVVEFIYSQIFDHVHYIGYPFVFG